MRLPIDIARAAIGVAAGFYFISLIPIYGAPFVGCDASGFMTLEFGCSDWPEFARGFVLVACFAIAPRRFRLPLVAVAILLIVAALGGVEYVKTGLFEYHSPVDAVFRFLAGLPVLLGGLGAYALYMSLGKITAGRAAN